jgi:thioredoxin 1
MKKFDKKEFAEITPEVLVVLIFGVTWRKDDAILSVLGSLEVQFRGKKVIFFRVLADEEMKFSLRYSIEEYPTVLFFRNGKEVGRMIGMGPRSAYQQNINELLEVE